MRMAKMLTAERKNASIFGSNPYASRVLARVYRDQALFARIQTLLAGKSWFRYGRQSTPLHSTNGYRAKINLSNKVSVNQAAILKGCSY
jgi:hypothetical protein